MCQLCGTKEERDQHREYLISFAMDLERMAATVRDLANGYIKPHSEYTHTTGPLARTIIRELVNDWM